MNKRQYTRREVKQLLSALERQCREAAKLAHMAEQEASKHSFSAYREFRDKVGEFQALVILIEQRLSNLVDARSDDLRDQFEKLDRVMLALLVRASMRFFFVLSANPILPMGAREIFVSELRSLHDAHQKLQRPNYAGKLGSELERDLETASLILEEIIDKAPSMLNFRPGEIGRGKAVTGPAADEIPADEIPTDEIEEILNEVVASRDQTVTH